MHLTMRARIGATALVVAVAGLSAPASGTSAATVAPTASAPGAAVQTAARRAPTPLLDFTVTRAGNLRLDSGPTRFHAGRIRFAVTGRGFGSVLFVRLARGYSFAELRSDVRAAFQGDMRALRRAIRKTTFLGGATVPPGTSERGTVVLPRRGRYLALTFGEAGPASPVRLRATSAVRRARPDVDAAVNTRDGARFGGDTVLPRRGTVQFKNTATDIPHFLNVVRVAEGTTRQEIIDSFSGPPSEEPPEWYRGEAFSTEVLSPGESMTIKVRLRAGSYAALCFFPDPDMEGMPHAAMGMVRMLSVE